MGNVFTHPARPLTVHIGLILPSKLMRKMKMT